MYNCLISQIFTGIILGVTISVFFVLLCTFLVLCGSRKNAHTRRAFCWKESRQRCWKNDRSAYATAGTGREDDHGHNNAQRFDSRNLRRDCTESLLLRSEPNQNIELQNWKQMPNTKTAASAAVNNVSAPTAALDQVL